MKALSIIQPWATWIANGHKSIECRTWKTPYRGRLLIVSSKTTKNMGYSKECKEWGAPTRIYDDSDLNVMIAIGLKHILSRIQI